MNYKLTAAFALVGISLGVAAIQGADNKVCNTTNSDACTSGCATCTVETTKCTEFLADGRTQITTTRSHDCGPGGPQKCPEKNQRRFRDLAEFRQRV